MVTDGILPAASLVLGGAVAACKTNRQIRSIQMNADQSFHGFTAREAGPEPTYRSLDVTVLNPRIDRQRVTHFVSHIIQTKDVEAHPIHTRGLDVFALSETRRSTKPKHRSDPQTVLESRQKGTSGRTRAGEEQVSRLWRSGFARCWTSCEDVVGMLVVWSTRAVIGDNRAYGLAAEVQHQHTPGAIETGRRFVVAGLEASIVREQKESEFFGVATAGLVEIAGEVQENQYFAPGLGLASDPDDKIPTIASSKKRSPNRPRRMKVSEPSETHRQNTDAEEREREGQGIATDAIRIRSEEPPILFLGHQLYKSLHGAITFKPARGGCAFAAPNALKISATLAANRDSVQRRLQTSTDRDT
ncbi:hypothetical protein C8R44DRAFT_726596 [Mycena epipterygia]|nr:hypothetical protein C8R44DRAFT_726596 [Mycena epipterygia]